jgi:5-formyltetrahydrofolate cyclo-ligase
MKDKQRVREDVWKKLKKVAKPDSRFHLNFGEFIPGFEGEEMALARLLVLPFYQEAKLIFITPDNCLEELRAQALRDGKTILVPTYGIRRGFVLLHSEKIPKEKEEYASWLDGMERMGNYVSLADVQQLGSIDLLVTGASVINYRGVRFGKGHGFFDLEWAMLFMIGVVTIFTPVIAFVHDCQVTNIMLGPSLFDTACDLIVTPSRIIKIENPVKPMGGILWEKLAPEMIEEIPLLQELLFQEL